MARTARLCIRTLHSQSRKIRSEGKVRCHNAANFFCVRVLAHGAESEGVAKLVVDTNTNRRDKARIDLDLRGAEAPLFHVTASIHVAARIHVNADIHTAARSETAH